MGKKRIAINLIANTVSYTTTVLIAFILTPYLVRTLGKSAYSFYPLANSFVSYLSIITIALNSMASRFITIEIAKNNEIRANTYFVSVLCSNIILAAVLIIPMSIIVIFIDLFLNIPIELVLSVRLLFILVFLSMLVNIITSVFGVAVFAQNRLDLGSLAEVATGVLRVTLYIILFTFFKPTILYVGVVALVLSICYFIFHFAFTRMLLPDIKLSRNYFDLAAVKEIISSGVWNSVNQIGAILLTSVSLLICNIYLGAEEAGDYAIILTVPNFINGIISMLTAVFMPTITKKYAEGDVRSLVNEVHFSQKVMGLLTNIPIVVFMVVGREFFDLWVPGVNSIKLQILSLMAMGHLIITGVTWPVSNLNIVMNKVKIPSLYLLGSGLVNIGLTLLLLNVTNLGIYTIAVSAFIVNIIWVGVFVPLYSCKELGVKWTTFYPSVVRTVSGGILILLIARIIKSLMPINSWITLLIVCSVSGLIGLFINSIIVLKPYEIKKILTKVKQVFLK